METLVTVVACVWLVWPLALEVIDTIKGRR